MCGRYTAAKDFTELIKLVGVIMSRVPIFGPRYNIAPTQLAPVIYHERHQPAMKLMRWGLIPSWAKYESVGNAHINARSETLPSRNAFREALKHRRCLIPADSFYEWQEREGIRQPFRVMLKSGEPFCFAGLWEKWIKPPSRNHAETDLDEAPPSETIESFTIITRAAKAAIAPLHNRMPVIASDSGRVLTGTTAGCAASASINSSSFSRNDLANSVTAVMSLRNWSSEGIWRWRNASQCF